MNNAADLARKIFILQDRFRYVVPEEEILAVIVGHTEDNSDKVITDGVCEVPLPADVIIGLKATELEEAAAFIKTKPWTGNYKGSTCLLEVCADPCTCGKTRSKTKGDPQ